MLLRSLLVPPGNNSVVLLRMHADLLKIAGVRAGVVFASGPARLTSTTSSMFMEATVSIISHPGKIAFEGKIGHFPFGASLWLPQALLPSGSTPCCGPAWSPLPHNMAAQCAGDMQPSITERLPCSAACLLVILLAPQVDQRDFLETL